MIENIGYNKRAKSHYNSIISNVFYSGSSAKAKEFMKMEPIQQVLMLSIVF